MSIPDNDGKVVPHTWGKWNKARVSSVDYVDGLFGKRAVPVQVLIQERVCANCGKTERASLG